MAQLKPYLTLAEALGAFQAQISEGAITSVTIAYIGEVAKLDTKPLTHSILKGLLSPVMGDEVNYVNAPAMAASRGIHISEEKADATEDFSTLIRLTVQAGNEENSVAGTIFGKYEPRLVRINKFRLEAIPEGHMLFIYNTDRPGVIGAIGSTIGKHKINIARMTVGQETGAGPEHHPAHHRHPGDPGMPQGCAGPGACGHGLPVGALESWGFRGLLAASNPPDPP